MELLLALTNDIPETLAVIAESSAFRIWILIIVIIDVIFKSIALWRAARMGMMKWFIALFLINSIGIFPIIFILCTRKRYAQCRCATSVKN